jgi:hypothetical protein
MNAVDVQKEISAIRREVGPLAYVSLSITADEGNKPVYICIYPYGMVRNEGYLFVRCVEFDEAISAIREKWVDYKVRFAQTITRKMALAIIRFTDEFGECTDAALRDEFDADQVAAYSADACKLADTMAAKGPFVITTVAGANAA